MRLQRIGRKNNPSYRVLVVDSRQGPKSGKFVDQIGSYDPKNDHVAIDGEKAKAWIAKGVQVSPTVHNLLITQKVIEGKKINVLPRKSPIKKERAQAPEPTPASETSLEMDAKIATEAVSEETQSEDIPSESPVEGTTPEATAAEAQAEPAVVA